MMKKIIGILCALAVFIAAMLTVSIPTWAEEAGPFATAAGKADKWSFYEQCTINSGNLADGKFTYINQASTSANGYVVAGYLDDYVQSGVTMEFDVCLEGSAINSYTAFQIRTPKTGWTDFVSGNYYTVWLWDGVMISQGTAVKANTGKSIRDGKVHTLAITVTDTAAGVKIDVVVDGTDSITWTDSANTHTGADKTGFCVYDYRGDSSFVKVSLADKGGLSGGAGDSGDAGDSATPGLMASAIADASNWTLQGMESSALGKNGVFRFSNKGSAAQKVALYRGNFVKSGEKMEFDIQMDPNGGFVGLQFRTGNTMGNWLDGDYTFQDDCYAVDIRPGAIGLRTNANKPSLAGAAIDVMDGQIHVLGVTITDVDAGVQIDVEVDGVQAFSYLDESKLCGPENTGFAIHDACWSTETVTYTIADKGMLSNPPKDDADEDKPEVSDITLKDALADKDNWAVADGFVKDEVLDSDTGVISFPKMAVMNYKGNFVQSGKTMEFDVMFEDKAAGSWTALLFRTNPNAALTGLTDNNAYAVWFTSDGVWITISPDARQAYIPATPFDGKVHSLAVTITDTEAGVKIDVVWDKKNTASWLDTNKTFGAERTGFGIHDWSAAGEMTEEWMSVADKGVLKALYPLPTIEKLSDAVADVNNWYFHGGNTADQLFNEDGYIEFENNNTTGTETRLMHYRGNFVESGKTMKFEFSLEKAEGSWTALLFCTDINGDALVDLVSKKSYNVWLLPHGAYFGANFEDRSNFIPVALYDGDIHSLEVTFTDTDAGRRMDVTIDGKSASWTDADNLFATEDHTGFVVQDWRSTTMGDEYFVLADEGVLTGAGEDGGDDNTGDDNTGDDNTGSDDNTGAEGDGDSPATGVAGCAGVAVLALCSAAGVVFTRKRK